MLCSILFRQLLGSPNSSVENIESPSIFTSLRRHRPIRSPLLRQTDENFTDGDDDILESLVKTATKAAGPRPTPRERKRTRHADRKSCKNEITHNIDQILHTLWEDVHLLPIHQALSFSLPFLCNQLGSFLS